MALSNVYIVSNQENTDKKALEFITGYIPPQRINKANRYLRSIDRNNSIISYFLLIYGLLKDYGIHNIPRIAVGRYGKPYFENSGISFSISHSDSGVCCGISDCGIGADIQDINIDFEGLTDMVMSQKERDIIIHSDEPAFEFVRFWTLKESICKYHGTGINDDLKKIDFSGFEDNVFMHSGLMFRSEKYSKFCVSACSENISPTFITKTLEQYIDEFLKLHGN